MLPPALPPALPPHHVSPEQQLVAKLTPVGICLIVLAMTTIGMQTPLKEFRDLFRWKPNNHDLRAYAIALVLNIVVQPVLACAVVWVALPHISPATALGLVLLGAVPGGSLSNIVAQIAGANARLNAALTITETVLCWLLVPLVALFVYPRLVAGQHGARAVPVAPLLLSLLEVAVPLLVGSALAPWARRHPRTHRALVGTTITVVLAYTATVLALVPLPPFGPALVACICALGAVGVAISLVVGLLARQPAANVTSIILEVDIPRGTRSLDFARAQKDPRSSPACGR